MAAYDFSTLSPLDFEELVRDLLQAELGVRLESFGPGRDGGIDLRHAASKRGLIVQAKHLLRGGRPALVRQAKSERTKVDKLKPRRYILVSSVSMTPATKDKLLLALAPHLRGTDDILGLEDLNNLLQRHPEVERHHFKLWIASTEVLEQVVYAGRRHRTMAELEGLSEKLRRFVHNDSVPAALEILNHHHALIISGPPGVGKSTLGRMLLALHRDEGYEIAVVDDVTQAMEAASERGRRVVFFDDFLGQIRLTRDGLRVMDGQLPPLLALAGAKESLRFVLTTRDYVLHQAQEQSDKLNEDLLRVKRLTLDVGVYTRAVRARILYNHLYFSDLTRDDLDEILRDEFYLTVIDHENFNPRLIEQLTSARYHEKSGEGVRDAIQAILKRPELLWTKPYREHIRKSARTLLIALAVLGGQSTLETLGEAFGRYAKPMGLRLAKADVRQGFRAALREVEGTFVAIDRQRVRVSNPGVLDFLMNVVREDRLADIVLPALNSQRELGVAWSTVEHEPDRGFSSTRRRRWCAVATKLAGDRSSTAGALLLGTLWERWRDDSIPDALLATAAAATRMAGAEELKDVMDLIDRLEQADLPEETAEALFESLLGEVASALRADADEMEPGDIRMLLDSLEYRLSGVEGMRLRRDVISSILTGLKRRLASCESLEDLELVEGQLTKLVDGDQETRLVERATEERRAELLGQERATAHPVSDPERFAKPGGSTDAEIRSLFITLRRG